MHIYGGVIPLLSSDTSEDQDTFQQSESYSNKSSINTNQDCPPQSKANWDRSNLSTLTCIWSLDPEVSKSSALGDTSA